MLTSICCLLASLAALARGQNCSSQVCLPTTYNAMDMPPPGRAGPLEIGFTLLLLDIYRVDHHDFTINTNVFSTLTWIDNRILLSNISNDSVNVDVRFLDKLWVPDIYFYDLKELQMTEGISPEKGLRLKRHDGRVEVTFMIEMELVFVCPMDVSNFPFDKHVCDIKMTSFSSYVSARRQLGHLEFTNRQ